MYEWTTTPSSVLSTQSATEQMNTLNQLLNQALQDMQLCVNEVPRGKKSSGGKKMDDAFFHILQEDTELQEAMQGIQLKYGLGIILWI